MAAITASRAEPLPIGALSKRSGVNIETIRYYERSQGYRAAQRGSAARAAVSPLRDPIYVMSAIGP